MIVYAYDDSSWGDLLTSYDGKTITYDAIGNPLNYGDQYFQWKHGRQLQRVGNGEEDWIFTYDANGMRTKRMCRDTGETYTYVYNGGQLTQMARSDGNTLFFTYDPQGYPAAFNWNGSNYYYVTNLQGDVIAILDGSKTMVVEYSYDAWGKILDIGGSMATTLGTLNPLTYRGYVYDHETGLYYLQSRYYNPEWGRFLNADALVATGQGMLGNNMFAYCNNNPVNAQDPNGYVLVLLTLSNDPTKDLFPSMGGSAAGGGAVVGGYALGRAAKNFKPKHTVSLGVTVSTSSYGHTTGWTGNISADTTGAVALQSSQTIGESTCLALGVSGGICKTISTADDAQYLAGRSNTVGFTVCKGVGITLDFAWFTNPNGEMEYAITWGVVWGGEFEVHTSESNTSTTDSWNPFQ